ncbi:D-alanine--D-alanine ligase [Candidatus Hartigia pinicola]|nr:D-alanine--D-alanine ligase [Candidatus Hartigia pinicola]
MAEKIAILFGGKSTERAVSIKSGNAVLTGLHQAGIDAHLIDVKYFPIHTLKEKGFNKAFIALHGRGGEDGTIQGMLSFLDIPYTGSGVIASALSIDKIKTKNLWECAGLSVSPYIYLKHSQFNIMSKVDTQKLVSSLGLPLIIKPSLEGSSVGISKINKLADLSSALKLAFHFNDTVLVEKWLSGSEYTVTILGDKILPAIRIQPTGDFYDYKAKYLSNTTQYFCPSGLNAVLEMKLSQLAMHAYQVIGCQGCGRVDVMQDENGQFYLLEINTSPGMTRNSLVPISARQANINFSELVVRILELAN